MSWKVSIPSNETGKDPFSFTLPSNITNLEELKKKLCQSVPEQKESNENKSNNNINNHKKDFTTLLDGTHDELLLSLFEFRPKEVEINFPLSNPYNIINTKYDDWNKKRLYEEIQENNLLTQYQQHQKDINSNNMKIVTSHKYLDTNILLGGIAKKEITEICGMSGTGKTQFIMQLALNCVMIPPQLGGLNTYPYTKCLIIDTTQRIKMTRIHEMSEQLWKKLNGIIKHRISTNINEHSQILKNDYLQRIFIYKIYNQEHFLDIFFNNILYNFMKKSENKHIKLIIIDDLTYYLKFIDNKSSNNNNNNNNSINNNNNKNNGKRYNANILLQIGQILQSIADEFDCAIVVVNTLTTKLYSTVGGSVASNSGGDFWDYYSGGNAVITPSLGSVWSHFISHRILFYIANNRHLLRVLKSPSIPSGTTCEFAIGKQGFSHIGTST